MSKRVQVSEEFFLRVAMLLSHLEGYQIDEKTQDIINHLQSEIDAKNASQERRTLYTACRTGKTEAQKNYFLEKYLETKGQPGER